MKASEKYRRVFGEIKSLGEPVSWTTGLSNMIEWLVWGTRNVLGVSKEQHLRLIVNWTQDPDIRGAELEELQKFVKEKLDAERIASERLNRYARPEDSIASAREALRRAKYFSEDYLNKEFDIYWTLVSDKYLDAYYRQYIELRGGGRWFTHGNSGLFENSTEIKSMQMDNLSYNPEENVLVANELKLGGKKNRDQMLKYALMYQLLMERGFIAPQTKFLLLFIGDRAEPSQWEDLLSEEIEFCQKSSKSTHKSALRPEVIEIARNAQYATTTWGELIEFNNSYFSSLDLPAQQVEQKLIWGFNETLSVKAFMQGDVDSKN